MYTPLRRAIKKSTLQTDDIARRSTIELDRLECLMSGRNAPTDDEKTKLSIVLSTPAWKLFGDPRPTPVVLEPLPPAPGRLLPLPITQATPPPKKEFWRPADHDKYEEVTMNEKLKLAIIQSGLYQYEVAQKVGITETRLSRIVRGRTKPTDHERWQISTALSQNDLFAPKATHTPQHTDLKPAPPKALGVCRDCTHYKERDGELGWCKLLLTSTSAQEGCSNFSEPAPDANLVFLMKVLRQLLSDFDVHLEGGHLCVRCEKPSGCFGSYHDETHRFRCDGCCEHSQIDGWCVPVADLERALEEMP